MKLLSFHVHTPNLLRELVNGNPSGGVLRQPVQILVGLLGEVSQRAADLDDPILDALMCDLTLYAISDPEDKEYNPKQVREVMATAKRYEKRRLDSVRIRTP